MNKRNILIRVSVALLLFNMVLGGVAGFNFWQSNKEINRIKETSQNDVLGENAKNIPVFDRNFVMSNQTFSSTRSFPTQQSVQDYLTRVDSPLKTYTTQGRLASYWIFAASRGETSSKFGVVPSINPGVILAYLEKEQSLISLKNYDVYADPQVRIKYAMGYGCPDTAVCDEKYNGFVNQVNWAAYQLQFNYNNALSGRNVAPYVVGRTITTLDEYGVFLTNEATAANYRYTPHVYWGNYNLWKIIVANGWGVDTSTYSMADIDRVNLANKDIAINTDTGGNLNLQDMLPILRAEYRLGDQSENIKLLQRFLRQQGYYMNRQITGMYGVPTDQALKNFRADKGIIGSFTNNAQADACKVLIAKDYVIGSTSDEIRELQKCLRDLGVFNWPTNTGFFGAVTRKAQTAARLGLNTPVIIPETPQAVVNPTPPTTPTTTNTCESLKSQTFKIGESSPRVKQLQDCMTAAGVFNWKFGSTGYYGPVSQLAFNRWVGRNVVVNFSCNELKQQTWVVGENSPRVRQLQDCMTTAGVFRWRFGSTGNFGEVTRQALIKWRGYL